MDKQKTCFFTGHRRLPAGKLNIIKEKLLENIEKLATQNGVETFITGGALGFDTLAANCAAKLREKYPNIRLSVYIPCRGQSKRWRINDKFYYRLLLSKADEIKYVSEDDYNDSCMHERNMKMIWDSSYCIAYCVLSNSGTGLTLRNAEAVGMKIVNIADEIYN